MLEIAYDMCMDAISKPSFRYIAKIIESWFNEGITTAEAVRSREGSKSAAAGRSNLKKENTDTSYDLNEWERFAMSFDPENGGN